MVTLIRGLLINALALMSVTLSGMVTLVSCLAENAPSPMVVTFTPLMEDGIFIAPPGPV
jgi:hypothetical protein